MRTGKVAVAGLRLFSSRVLELAFGSEPAVSLLKSWDLEYSVPGLGFRCRCSLWKIRPRQERGESELYPFMEAKLPPVNTAQAEAALHATVVSCLRNHLMRRTQSTVCCQARTSAGDISGHCVKGELCYSSQERVEGTFYRKPVGSFRAGWLVDRRDSSRPLRLGKHFILYPFSSAFHLEQTIPIQSRLRREAALAQYGRPVRPV